MFSAKIEKKMKFSSSCLSQNIQNQLNNQQIYANRKDRGFC